MKVVTKDTKSQVAIGVLSPGMTFKDEYGQVFLKIQRRFGLGDEWEWSVNLKDGEPAGWASNKQVRPVTATAVIEEG